MTAFDWAWPTRIDRATVEAALQLDFLAAARNVVLVAPQGLGKTMIAQNIAHAAVLAGHHVLFKTAAEVLLDLGAQESARGLARRLNSRRAASSSSRRSAISRTMPAPPTCSSRSSVGATSGAASC